MQCTDIPTLTEEINGCHVTLSFLSESKGTERFNEACQPEIIIKMVSLTGSTISILT